VVGVTSNKYFNNSCFYFQIISFFYVYSVGIRQAMVPQFFAELMQHTTFTTTAKLLSVALGVFSQELMCVKKFFIPIFMIGSKS
jgi:hypothetical protein